MKKVSKFSLYTFHFNSLNFYNDLNHNTINITIGDCFGALIL